MKFTDAAGIAKTAIKKRIAPTNADRYAQAEKLREKNNIKEEKIKSMEAVSAERRRAIALQERERRARDIQADKPSSQKVAWAHQLGNRDPFEAFNSPVFSLGSSSGNWTGSTSKKRKKEPDFPDFNFL